MGFDTDGFLEDMQGYQRAGKIELLLRELEPDEAKVVEQALSNPDIPANRISIALKRQGHEIGPEPVRTWRDKHNVSS